MAEPAGSESSSPAARAPGTPGLLDHLPTACATRTFRRASGEPAPAIVAISEPPSGKPALRPAGIEAVLDDAADIAERVDDMPPPDYPRALASRGAGAGSARMARWRGAFLMSDRAPEGSMQLFDLDGFLVGIAIGSELIMPSEWVPVIWGGDEPEFESIGEAQRVLDAIMGRRALGVVLDGDTRRRLLGSCWMATRAQ